jgi:hypothetical protein
MKGAAKVKRKRYKKQILDKISNLSPKESKELWKILIYFSKLVIPNSIIFS